MLRAAVDIGGTFTDCFIEWEGRHLEGKALTAHHNLAVGFLEAVANAAAELAVPLEEVLARVDAVRYGTTLGTNALIERRGPRIGVLVTMGFESLISLSRGRGYGEGLPRHLQVDLLRATRPQPLVAPGLVVGIQERIDAVGYVLLPLNVEDVRVKIRRLVDEGVQVFVVSLVNSVVNPAHEEQIEEIIRDEYPSSLLGSYPVILSHRISRRKSEYARTMAAVICGFLHEHMFYALGNLEDALRERGYRKPVLLIHNTGGIASLESTHALQTIHSGPVAGLAAAQHLAREYDIPVVVATDMGGTSFDIGIMQAVGSWIYDFQPVVDRWRVSTPMVYLRTLGAGGGSIARYERLWRTVEVGPESAGSDPGPACYGRGGTQPTVTDANLILGYLDPEYYADGRLQLDPLLAELTLEEHVAQPLGISVIEAARQIKRKVDAKMADAIFKEVATRGFDPRKVVLVSYGGAGPAHCCGFARELTVRSVVFPDGTLRENCLIKICLEARKRGDVLELDFRGTSPQFLNRANNTELQALKGMLAQEFLTFVWPDQPRNQAVFAPMRLITDHGSAVDCTREAPTAQSMMTFFPAFTALQMVVPKFLHACAKRYTNIHAPWYNMITTFIYGGVNQYGETVGNLCADLNGMSGGARENAAGENSIAPIFAAMTDLGEQELLEEETPIVKIVPHRLLCDNQGFGKYRGGTGYQVIATVRRSDAFGFMTTCVGSKFPSTYGLFGGYGAPTYPLCKVKGVNAFERLVELPEEKWTIPSIMNERPFPEAKYSTHHMGMQFEIVKQGEVYMISQGAGGRYGDPLDRDPETVMRDVREGLVSDWVAQEIYRVVYDPRTRSVDAEATERARVEERQHRIQRGKPYDDFVREWVQPEPPENVSYYGSWDNRDLLYLGNRSEKAVRGATHSVMMPDPREVRIAELEQRLRAAGLDFQE